MQDDDVFMTRNENEKPRTIVMHYRAPCQLGLTQVSVTHNGPRGFTLEIKTVSERPGREYAEGTWKLDVLVP